MRALLFPIAMFCAACGRRAAAGVRPGAGTVSVQWTGKLRGGFSAPATARWCAADSLLEIIAVRGDTATGLTLMTRDSVRVEGYVVNETRNFTPGRPQASVALRMLGEMTLFGFDAMAGQVMVTQGGSRMVSGTLDVRLRSVTGADTIQMKGSFERIAVLPATGVCGRANKPGAG